MACCGWGGGEFLYGLDRHGLPFMRVSIVTVSDRNREKHTLLNEHNNTNMEPQPKKQQFQSFSRRIQQQVDKKDADKYMEYLRFFSNDSRFTLYSLSLLRRQSRNISLTNFNSFTLQLQQTDSIRSLKSSCPSGKKLVWFSLES